MSAELYQQRADEIRLISREELQFRFCLAEKFVTTWLEAPKDRMPHFKTGQRGPMFFPPDVWAWLKRKFGQGYETEVRASEPQRFSDQLAKLSGVRVMSITEADVNLKTKVGRPRAFDVG